MRGIGDDFLYGFGLGCGRFGEVQAGDLEHVKEQAGALGVEAAVGDALDDDADGGLDGGAVLGQREVEGREGVAQLDRFGGAGGVVVVAEELAAERWTAATAAVVVDVAALIVLRFGGCGHACTPPPGLGVKSSWDCG